MSACASPIQQGAEDGGRTLRLRSGSRVVVEVVCSSCCLGVRLTVPGRVVQAHGAHRALVVGAGRAGWGEAARGEDVGSRDGEGEGDGERAAAAWLAGSSR